MVRGGAERGRGRERGEEADTQRQQVCESSSQRRRRKKEGGGGGIRARETVWLQSGGTQTLRGRERERERERERKRERDREEEIERREGKKAVSTIFCPQSSTLTPFLFSA